MDPDEWIRALQTLSVETGSLACLGCKYEDKCSIKGCALIRYAVDVISDMRGNTSERQTDAARRGPNVLRRHPGCEAAAL